MSALKLWSSDCIIEAYFNQSKSSTEEERKLKDRLRKKKLRHRMSSMNMDKKFIEMSRSIVEESKDITSNPTDTFERRTTKQQLSKLSTS